MHIPMLRCAMKRDKYQSLTIKKLGIIGASGPPGNKKKDTVQPVSFTGENIREVLENDFRRKRFRESVHRAH